jgi:hyaluronate lyase
MTAVKADSMHFTNMGGYVFLGGANVKYRKAQNTSSFLEIIQEHGNMPSDAKYAYVYLPESSADQTVQYQSNPDVQIIKNTKYVHVVKETKLGITGYAFYDTGIKSGDEYEVYAKTKFAMMLSKGENGETILNVSDPTHLLGVVEFDIKVEGATSVTCDEAKLTSTIASNGVINVKLNTVGAAGKTFTVVIK